MPVCTGCNTLLSPEKYNTPELVPCPFCNAHIQVNVFPALYTEYNSGDTGEKLVEDNESGCFFHPGKKAEIACSSCGRFLCGLCDMDLNGRHICPLCLEKGKKNRRITNLENERILYDSLAVNLAFYPLLLFWFTIITAPLVIFIVIRYWKTPLSITGRTKIRYIISLIFAGLQIAGWAMFFISLVTD